MPVRRKATARQAVHQFFRELLVWFVFLMMGFIYVGVGFVWQKYVNHVIIDYTLMLKKITFVIGLSGIFFSSVRAVFSMINIKWV
jgi:hypothetical protein